MYRALIAPSAPVVNNKIIWKMKISLRTKGNNFFGMPSIVLQGMVPLELGFM
jgi:hypothetical protein